MTDAEIESTCEDEEAVDSPVFYSQQAMVGVSFYDFSLVFFQESFAGSRPVANVTMPPAAAKLLAETLGDYVDAYEERYGAIRLPPEEDGFGDPGDDDEYEEEEG
jgi:hypothetical protein